jgi:hypothetical protein
MGFLSKLFGMPPFGGATNALLVELTLPTLTDAQKIQLKTHLIETFRKNGTPDISAEVALISLNQTPRFVQLNFLAIAMKELKLKPSLKREPWQKVKDPFDPRLADESALRAVARRLYSSYKVEALLGEEPISFDSW